MEKIIEAVGGHLPQARPNDPTNNTTDSHSDWTADAPTDDPARLSAGPSACSSNATLRHRSSYLLAVTN